MLHTTEQIIANQSQFGKEIHEFLKQDLRNSLIVLKDISTEDVEVQSKVLELRKKVKRMKQPSIHSLFFMNNHRSKKYYAWWDVETEEAIIYPYDKNE